MIKNIIFDIGQVLAWFRWKEYIKDFGFSDEYNERIATATVKSKYWKEIDRGVMPLQDIIDACVELDPQLENEIRLFYSDMSALVEEFDYAESLVSCLKQQSYRIFLLSNYGEKNFEYARNTFRFIPLVDGMVISYQVKHLKPQLEIYEDLLTAYHLIPEECVFLDDLPENLEGARQAGIQTVHFTGLKAGIEGLKKLMVTCPFDEMS